jgi:hypothetical protein
LNDDDLKVQAEKHWVMERGISLLYLVIPLWANPHKFFMVLHDFYVSWISRRQDQWMGYL